MWEQGESPFAQILRKLLDKTGLFTREEWATFCEVNILVIEGWIKDRTFPSAHILRSIIRVLEESDGIPQNILAEFKALARRPAIEVTPLASLKAIFEDRHGPYQFGMTVGHYLVLPVFEGFMRNLGPLEPHEQEEILLEAAEACRKKQQARQPQPAPE